MIIINNFLFNFTNFCIIIWFFFTKLLTLGILFSTAVNAELVAKPLILNFTFYFTNFSIIICFLTSPLVSGIFFFKSDLSV